MVRAVHSGEGAKSVGPEGALIHLSYTSHAPLIHPHPSTCHAVIIRTTLFVSD